MSSGINKQVKALSKEERGTKHHEYLRETQKTNKKRPLFNSER